MSSLVFIKAFALSVLRFITLLVIGEFIHAVIGPFFGALKGLGTLRIDVKAHGHTC